MHHSPFQSGQASIIEIWAPIATLYSAYSQNNSLHITKKEQFVNCKRILARGKRNQWDVIPNGLRFKSHPSSRVNLISIWMSRLQARANSKSNLFNRSILSDPPIVVKLVIMNAHSMHFTSYNKCSAFKVPAEIHQFPNTLKEELHESCTCPIRYQANFKLWMS